MSVHPNTQKLFGVLFPQTGIAVTFAGWMFDAVSTETAAMCMFLLTTVMVAHIALNAGDDTNVVGITTSEENIEYERL